MNDFINITYADLQKIIIFSQTEGRKGNYIRQLYLVRPKSASAGIDSGIAIDSSPLRSATEGEPIPIVVIC